MLVGYARTSTLNQKTDRQLVGVSGQYGSDMVWYEDRGVSGTMPFASRPAGKEVMAGVVDGTITTIVVWELSRLGRNLKDILGVLDICYEHSCQVVILKEHLKLLDDDGKPNAITKLLIAVIGSLAEVELDTLAIRRAEGIEVAKRAGKYRGRKKGSTLSPSQFLQKDKSKRIVELLKEDYPVTYIAKLVPCSPNLVYKVRETLERVA